MSAEGPEFVVGRGSTGDFQVIDFRMSREHFQLVYKDGRWELHDLSSSNGTVVNDERKDLTALQDGDTIVAGDTSFRVDIGHGLSGSQGTTPHSRPTKRS